MGWMERIYGDRPEAQSAALPEQSSVSRDAFVRMVQATADNHGCNLESDLILSVLKQADIDQIPTCSALELKAWTDALALRLIRERGQVPRGWTQLCHCKGCGPVYLWPGASAECDGCPWCWNRVKGLIVPHPAEETRI